MCVTELKKTRKAARVGYLLLFETAQFRQLFRVDYALSIHTDAQNWGKTPSPSVGCQSDWLTAKSSNWPKIASLGFNPVSTTKEESTLTSIVLLLVAILIFFCVKIIKTDDTEVLLDQIFSLYFPYTQNFRYSTDDWKFFRCKVKISGLSTLLVRPAMHWAWFSSVFESKNLALCKYLDFHSKYEIRFMKQIIQLKMGKNKTWNAFLFSDCISFIAYMMIWRAFCVSHPLILHSIWSDNINLIPLPINWVQWRLFGHWRLFLLNSTTFYNISLQFNFENDLANSHNNFIATSKYQNQI